MVTPPLIFRVVVLLALELEFPKLGDRAIGNFQFLLPPTMTSHALGCPLIVLRVSGRNIHVDYQSSEG